MTRNTIYSIAGIVIVAGVGGWLYFRSTSGPAYQLVTVVQGTIVQQVLASGNVQSPMTINLNFESSGKLVSLNVAVNQKVSAGEVLAQQDTSVLQAQRAQAQAAVNAATAALNTLQAGATPQSIAVSQAALTVAAQALQNSYATVQNTLADAYAKGNDAVTSELAPFFSNAQTISPQLTFSVNDSQVSNDIVSQRVQAGGELSTWQAEDARIANSSDTSQLDQALSDADGHLTMIQRLLNTAVTAVAEGINLSSTNAAAYRTDASTGLSETTAAISEIRTLEQSIASEKAAIMQAQAQLNLTSATSTSNDIAAAQAHVEQAQANAAAIEAQIRQLEIIAPVSGVVTATNGTVGEVITPQTTVASLIPQGALEVQANVSEDNVVGIAVGEPVSIELDAFPSGTTFAGTVSEIDPAQTVIGGAIYYQTTILFNQNYPGIKPGMTANVSIETGSSTNALIVPASAIQTSGTSTFVQIYQNGALAKQNVTTGLKSQDGMVQVTSGLLAGEHVTASQ